MSNYHILSQDTQRKSVDVIFHIPIPATNNSAKITWQAAIVKELGGASNIVSVLPGITSEEDSSLKAGALLEKRVTVRFSSINLTNAQRLAAIKAAFTAETSALVAEKAITLDFMGYEGDV